jgi:hypothetical protein
MSSTVLRDYERPTSGMSRLTVNFKTATEISDLGPTTLWKLVGEGRLEVVHVGRRALIVFKSLERLLTTPEADDNERDKRSAAASRLRAHREDKRRLTADRSSSAPTTEVPARRRRARKFPVTRQPTCPG